MFPCGLPGSHLKGNGSTYFVIVWSYIPFKPHPTASLTFALPSQLLANPNIVKVSPSSQGWAKFKNFNICWERNRNFRVCYARGARWIDTLGPRDTLSSGSNPECLLEQWEMREDVLWKETCWTVFTLLSMLLHFYLFSLSHISRNLLSSTVFSRLILSI